jgi:hypothetical protein
MRDRMADVWCCRWCTGMCTGALRQACIHFRMLMLRLKLLSAHLLCLGYTSAVRCLHIQRISHASKGEEAQGAIHATHHQTVINKLKAYTACQMTSGDAVLHARQHGSLKLRP